MEPRLGVSSLLSRLSSEGVDLDSQMGSDPGVIITRYGLSVTCFYICVRVQGSGPPSPPKGRVSGPTEGDALLNSTILVRIPYSRAILLQSSSRERTIRSS